MAVRILKDSWWVDFRFDNTRYRRRSPDNTKAGAQAYEALLRQKLARGDGIARVPETTQDQLFETFAETWFREYVQPNNKHSEQRAKQYILRASLVPFFGKTPVGKITGYMIHRYVARLVKQRLSHKTINNRLTVLRKCLCTAYEWLELETAPPRIKWLKCPTPKTDYLSSDECQLLLSHADGVVYEMILTALRTGMRQGELRGLQWSSIDWQNRNLAVRHSRYDYTKELVSPKSNRERHIPMDTDIYDVLYRRKRNSGYVFTDAAGEPFDCKRLLRRLQDVCSKAGLRRIGWHTLRHTFASQLAMGNVPLPAVQKLLGHATITMTMRYAHVAPSTLRTAIEVLNPKQRLTGSFGQPVGNQWPSGHQAQIA
jgi:integrase